jgi:hypothetical protein
MIEYCLTIPIFDMSSSLKRIRIKIQNSTLWGDETLGRHALLSRGWGQQNKQSVEPTLPMVRPTRVDH